MTADRSAEVFAALADPTRRQLLDHLSRRGPASATELAEVLPISRQAVSKHLALLEEAGLVAGDRSGRERRFRLTPGPMSEAVSWMAGIGAEWDDRLEALRRHLRRR
jgi:DNA-binding transcriptional ArsR family regulator